jgi:hypothetical protein
VNYAKNNKYFDEIVNMGYDVLPLIEDYIKNSSNDRLREYLLSIVAEKIAKVDLKTLNKEKPWEIGKEFNAE